jgi:hypothetical protein
MNKGQSSIVMMVLVLMVFGGLAVFLLSMVQTVSQEDYMNIYAHNMLISVMRTDTGKGADCALVSDTLSCASYGMICDSGEDCSTVARSKISEFMTYMNEAKTTYDWYIGVYDKNDFLLLELGNTELVAKKTKKWSASETVYDVVGTTQNTFNVRLILAKAD